MRMACVLRLAACAYAHSLPHNTLHLHGGLATAGNARGVRLPPLLCLRGGAANGEDTPLGERIESWLRSKSRRWYGRVFLFWLTARVPFYSIAFDDWAAVRSASSVEKTARAKSITEEILRRRRRGAKVQKLIGVGYTPRIVALAGLMLRSLHVSTALPSIWDPPIGLGAGACVAARWAQREWLACLMVGWYVGGAYWCIMGVAPPAGFAGVPVAVRQVRNVRL